MKRVAEFKRHEVENFNEVMKMLKIHKIPAYFINPEILKAHNEGVHDVARIHQGSAISIDSLAVLVCGDNDIARAARKLTNEALRAQPRGLLEEVDEDKTNSKLHLILDGKED